MSEQQYSSKLTVAIPFTIEIIFLCMCVIQTYAWDGGLGLLDCHGLATGKWTITLVIPIILNLLSCTCYPCM